MRFDLPIPYRVPGQGLDRARENVSRWSRSQTIYRHFDRRNFENWIASTTTQVARMGGAPRAGRADRSSDEVSFEDRARDLLERELASPAGLAQMTSMDTRGVQAYLGIEAIYRKTRDIQYTRGEWHGVGPGGRDYQRQLEKLRKGKALGARSLEELLAAQSSQMSRAAMERAYRTANMRGDFSFDDSAMTVPWRGVRRMALAMGGITDTQYALLVPGLPTARVVDDLVSWCRAGMLERLDYPEGGLPTRYVVARPEAEKAIADGDLTRHEFDATARLRLNQREHDEAVGDAMLMLGIAAQEVGLTVEYVIPESRMVERNRRGPVPDFIIGFGDGYGVIEISVEVIGKGGAYRESGFVEAQKKAGHVLYYPAYFGGGGRFV